MWENNCFLGRILSVKREHVNSIGVPAISGLSEPGNISVTVHGFKGFPPNGIFDTVQRFQVQYKSQPLIRQVPHICGIATLG